MIKVAEQIYRDILAIQCEHLEPVEIRVGQLDYHDLLREPSGTGNPLWLDFSSKARTLFGVPIRPVNLDHCVSIIATRRDRIAA